MPPTCGAMRIEVLRDEVSIKQMSIELGRLAVGCRDGEPSRNVLGEIFRKISTRTSRKTSRKAHRNTSKKRLEEDHSISYIYLSLFSLYISLPSMYILLR